MSFSRETMAKTFYVTLFLLLSPIYAVSFAWIFWSERRRPYLPDRREGRREAFLHGLFYLPLIIVLFVLAGILFMGYAGDVGE